MRILQQSLASLLMLASLPLCLAGGQSLQAPSGLAGALQPLAQSVPLVTASDAPAEAALTQALQSAGGAQALATVQDFTATGRITYYWAGTAVQGTVTLRGRGIDQFRLDAVLPDGTRSWTVSHGTGTLEKPDGTKSSIPGHNAIGMGSLTFPYLYLMLASSASGTTVSTVGTAQANGISATQIRLQRHYASSIDPNGVIARLTTRDFFIDPTTGLVVKTEAMTHPTNTFTMSLPEDIYFSNYQRVNGIAAPFTITETVNGQKIWTIQLSSIQFNTGLSDSAFQL